MHRLPSRPALACHVTQSDLELQNQSLQVGPRTLNSLACLRCLCLPSETAKASCNELQISRRAPKNWERQNSELRQDAGSPNMLQALKLWSFCRIMAYLTS